jgi:hypothetical protein
MKELEFADIVLDADESAPVELEEVPDAPEPTPEEYAHVEEGTPAEDMVGVEVKEEE